MKIVADESIPLVKDYFGHADELVLKPGRHITRDDVLTADILLVRSVTTVDSDLLNGTAVKFVGTATTGFDHMDTDWLDKAGIQWYAAEGCNTIAVVEYVIAAIAAMKKLEMLPDRKLRAAVVGVGKIGSLVAEKLELLGFDVVYCDPLRAERDPNFVSTPLEDLSQLDLVTFHTPLTVEGEHSTQHLIKKAFLLRQKKNCILLNAGRGAVIDFSDLEEYGQHLYWCLDVWEHEPHINFEILDLAALATPHIAGYTLQSKQRGIEMVYQAACERNIISKAPTEEPPYPTQTILFANAMVDWSDVILKIYDPQKTTAIMKNALVENGSNATFDLLRKNFPARNEFAYVTLQDLKMTDADKALLKALGIVSINASASINPSAAF
jgi:erythronate-4-phosphate dehydrogenase